MVSRVGMKVTVGAPLDHQVSRSGQGASFGYAWSFDRPDFRLSNRIPPLRNVLPPSLWTTPSPGVKPANSGVSSLGCQSLLLTPSSPNGMGISRVGTYTSPV